ncbi:hypothetical protein [Pedobacter sp. BAL39]|uniref:hypothetical protein n=1 Tax=Pedobacter sp. BAL39 TaxID=391596 RepID=UPI0012FA088C|nr:hypothetical protein [Pedobacter sp. BAL39]
MKRILIGLIAIGMAVTGSVFANAKRDIESSLAPVTYSNLGSGVYVRGTWSCTTPDPNQCLLTFPNPANNTPPNGIVLPHLPTNLGIGTFSGPLARS